jgi:hypothetical protein
VESCWSTFAVDDAAGAAGFFAAVDFEFGGAFVVDAGFFAGGVCARVVVPSEQTHSNAALIAETRRPCATTRGRLNASVRHFMAAILLLNWLGRVGIFAEGFRIARAEHFHHPMIKIICAMSKYRLKPAFIFFTCLPDFIF